MQTCNKNNLSQFSKAMTPSIHDEMNITFGLAKHFYDKQPTTQNFTWEDFKDFLIKNARQVVADKTQITSLTPVSWIEGCTSKEETNAVERHAIIFDFDGLEDKVTKQLITPADIPAILDILRPYTHIAWTSYSNNITGKGPRLRVYVPIKQSINKKVWQEQYMHRLKQWIESIGLTGGNQVDQSCWKTFAQVGAAPCINTNGTNTIDFKINDDNTEVLDLDKVLVGFSNPVIIEQNNHATEFSDYEATSDQAAAIVRFLRDNSELHSIDRDDRINMARAFRACPGLSAIDFEQLDCMMKKPGSNTTTKTAWKEGGKNRGDTHFGLIVKHLTHEQRRICGFTPAIPTVKAFRETLVEQSKWDIEKTLQPGEYLDRSIYKGYKRVLLNAAMGSGKNESINKYKNKTNDRIICLAPLLTIVGQANGLDEDGNTIKADLDNPAIKTFVYDTARATYDKVKSGEIDPSEVTLIIDECHNLKTIAYRQTAVHYVLELLKLDFKQIVLQSATIGAEDFDSVFKSDIKVRVTRSDAAIRTYHHIDYHEDVKTISVVIQQIKDAKNAGQKALVLLNDNKQLNVIQEYFNKSKNIAVDTINRKTSRLLGHEANLLARDGDYVMPDDLDAWIGTYSMVEGINIKNDIDNCRVIVVGKEHPQYITQLCGRMRKAKSIDCYHIYRQSEYKLDPQTYIDNKVKEIASTAQLLSAMELTLSHVSDATNILYGFEFSNKRNASTYSFNNSMFYDEREQCYVKSSASALFMNAAGEERIMYTNQELAHATMQYYGFELGNDYSVIVTEEDENIDKAYKAAGRIRAKLLKDETAKFIHAIDLCGDTTLQKITQQLFYLEHHAVTANINDIHQELFDIIKAFANSKRDVNALKKYLIDAVNKKNVSYDVIIDNAEDEVGDSMRLFAKSFVNTGDKLSMDECNAIIKATIDYKINALKAADSALSDFEIYKKAVSGDRFEKYRVKNGGISFVNGAVVVDVARPSHLMKSLGIDGSPKQIRENGVKVSRYIVD